MLPQPILNHLTLCLLLLCTTNLERPDAKKLKVEQNLNQHNREKDIQCRKETRILNTVHAMDGDSEEGGDEFGAQGQIHHHHQLQL